LRPKLERSFYSMQIDLKRVIGKVESLLSILKFYENPVSILRVWLLKTFGINRSTFVKLKQARKLFYVDGYNVDQLIEAAKKLYRLIKAGGRIFTLCRGDLLLIEINGLRYFVRTKGAKNLIDDVLLGPLLGVHYESKEFNALLEKIQQYKWLDPVFVDVGAYIGGYSVKLCQRGLKVIAIEPHPENYSILRMNLIANKCKFEAYNIAAGDSEGTISLCEEESLGSSYVSVTPNPSTQCYNVKMLRLDRALPKDKPIFMKVDVEGFEVHVLKGMDETMDNVICLLIEVADKNLANVYAFLRRRGFDINVISRYTIAPKRYLIEYGGYQYVLACRHQDVGKEFKCDFRGFEENESSL